MWPHRAVFQQQTEILTFHSLDESLDKTQNGNAPCVLDVADAATHNATTRV